MRTLPERVLCLVTDLDRAGGEAEMLRIVAAAVRGGVNMVQVRAHELDDASLTALARKIVAVAGEALVVVNGPVTAAVESGAHGVHLRESSATFPVEETSQLLVGRSVHSLAAARKAEAEGADYLVLGTIFPSRSHPDGETGGLELVSTVTQEVNVPVIGIGGITAENAPSVISAGAVGVAVIGAIIDADSPLDAARGLSKAVGLLEKR